MTLTTQSIRIEGTGQHVEYREQLASTRPAHTVRLHIHVDSYRDQAYARAERWDGTRWHEVATISGSALRTDLHIGYGQGPITAGAFKQDRDALYTLVTEVLR